MESSKPIPETVLSLATFAAWLQQHDLAEEFASAGDGGNCPIACYLRATSRSTNVSPNVDQHFIATVDGVYITPEWAAKFIDKIDTTYTIDSFVTYGQALEALNYQQEPKQIKR